MPGIGYSQVHSQERDVSVSTFKFSSLKRHYQGNRCQKTNALDGLAALDLMQKPRLSNSI
ncbi:hypothetical protein A2T76_27130 [Pseudomonas brenneri]|nr:hypothetical protein A2T76_27130 [Pseudomonas brenneri]